MAKTTLNEVSESLRRFIEANQGRFPFALIGGLAVSVRTEPRFTGDVDFAIAVDDDAAAEAVVHHFLQRRFTLATTLENQKHQRLSTVRLSRAPATPLVDLLFASTGIEAEIVKAAEHLTVLQQQVPVARTGHLIAMKLLARNDRSRRNDAADLHALCGVADAEEWMRAEHAVQLVFERGFTRGRDLHAALRELREQL
jgi:predicted nucleotidyltransferase